MIEILNKFIPENETKDVINLIEQSERVQSKYHQNTKYDLSVKNVKEVIAESNSQLDNLIKDIDRKVCKVAGRLFGVYTWTLDRGVIYDYQPGDFFITHSDSQYTVDNHDFITAVKFAERDLSYILFLNDSEQGGDIHFVHSGKTFKPSAGTLLVYTSDWRNDHEITPVITGHHYMITNWFPSEPALVAREETIPQPYADYYRKRDMAQKTI